MFDTVVIFYGRIIITQQDKARFENVSQNIGRALNAFGFDRSSLKGGGDNNLMWGTLGAWGKDKYKAALWFGEWFKDLPVKRFWYGFQGTRSAMSELQSSVLELGLSAIPPDFIEYDYGSSWTSYPSSRSDGFVFERDNEYYYIGHYDVSTASSDEELVRMVTAFVGTIVEAIEPSETADIEALKADKKISATLRKALISARLGQGRFRRDLEKVWGGRCALTGCTTREALRASHIKPWRLASDEERLSAHNGLLLHATLDALFDKGLVSFRDDGQILIGRTLSRADKEILMLDGMRLSQQPSIEQREFLRFHRDELLH